MNIRTKIRIHKHLILGALIVFWIAALTATHIPQQKLPKLPTSDTGLHLLGFFVLGSLFWLSLLAYGIRAMHRIPLVIFTLMIYAALDETTQALVNRTPALGDWAADSAGMFLAVVVWEILRLVVFGSESKPEPAPKNPYEQHPV